MNVNVSSPEFRENHNIKVANTSFENMGNLRYCGMI
jgi:hypothetical protein